MISELIDLPTVSIITPSFNQGRFIAQAIDSVLAQDYPYIEYLVVDGGSSDETLDVLRGYGSRVRWMSEADRGQADAINKGFRYTHGAVLAWLNADDVYAPGAVRRAVAELVQHPDLALVYGDAEYVDENGHSTGGARHVRAFDLHQLIHELDFIVQPATFFRRAAFDAVGGLDNGLRYCLDYDLWIKLAQQYPVRYLPDMLAQVRVYPTTKTASGGLSRVLEIERMIRRYGRRHLPTWFYSDMYVARRNAIRAALASGDWAAALRHGHAGAYYIVAYLFRRIRFGRYWERI